MERFIGHLVFKHIECNKKYLWCFFKVNRQITSKYRKVISKWQAELLLAYLVEMEVTQWQK